MTEEKKQEQDLLSSEEIRKRNLQILDKVKQDRENGLTKLKNMINDYSGNIEFKKGLEAVLLNLEASNYLLDILVNDLVIINKDLVNIQSFSLLNEARLMTIIETLTSKELATTEEFLAKWKEVNQKIEKTKASKK